MALQVHALPGYTQRVVNPQPILLPFIGIRKNLILLSPPHIRGKHFRLAVWQIISGKVLHLHAERFQFPTIKQRTKPERIIVSHRRVAEL